MLARLTPMASTSISRAAILASCSPAATGKSATANIRRSSCRVPFFSSPAAAAASARPTARLAGARGYDVAVNYHSNSNAAAKVVEAVKAGGGKAVAMQGDMGIEDDIERVFDETARHSARSRISCTAPASSARLAARRRRPPTTLREVLDVDTFGALLCLRACVRRMSTKTAARAGRW